MTKPHFSILATSFAGGPRPRNAATTLAVLWLLLYCPTSIAQIPQSIAIALLALLGHRWANQAFGARTAFYTAIALLTSVGVYLHTRTPRREAYLALFLSAALFAFQKSLTPNLSPTGVPHDHEAEGGVIVGSVSAQPITTGGPSFPGTFGKGGVSSEARPLSFPPAEPTPEQPSIAWYAGPYFYPYVLWLFLSLAFIAGGAIALILFFATTLLYLTFTRTFADWRRLKPFTGTLLFFVIAARWIIFTTHATLPKPLNFLPLPFDSPVGHLPDYLFWSQPLLYLLPWSLFLPLAILALDRRMRHQTITLTRHIRKDHSWAGAFLVVGSCVALVGVSASLNPHHVQQLVICMTLVLLFQLVSRRIRAHLPASPFHRIDPQQRTILLLSLFAAVTLLTYSFTPNNPASTLPAYLPILLLTAATITRAEQTYSTNPEAQRWLTIAHATLSLAGLALTATLTYALITHHPIQVVTIHPEPAIIAILTSLLGPSAAWLLRTQRRHLAATTAIAFTSAALLATLYLIR